MRPTVTPLSPTNHDVTPADLFAVLATMVDLGRGPHPLQRIVEESGIPRRTTRAALDQLIEAQLCKATTGMPSHYETGVQAVEATSRGLTQALPGVHTGYRDDLRTLQQRTGHVALLHGYLTIPSLRICTDLCAGDRRDFEQQVKANPAAAERLSKAPLHEDAAGKVIAAHLQSPHSIELQRIRHHGYALTAAPLAGWTLLSVPVYARGGEGPTSLQRGYTVAGAVSLLVSGPIDPNGVPAQWLDELWNTATQLEQSAPDQAATHHTHVRRAV
ncbi:hypothetical protein [Streptomyces noursei]|uniref:IclR family transcriptional regulator n=1 Tax=Streptomyces noursei TaxID=1971 RepID=A0A2N8PR47_STRNR|nr:hypothetical protein [Streptomyces noursei]PNE43461.1 hypothetical protein AOB60_00615 [Streptomyces noursei]